jgi:hypothetical protein
VHALNQSRSLQTSPIAAAEGLPGMTQRHKQPVADGQLNVNNAEYARPALRSAALVSEHRCSCSVGIGFLPGPWPAACVVLDAFRRAGGGIVYWTDVPACQGAVITQRAWTYRRPGHGRAGPGPKAWTA